MSAGASAAIMRHVAQISYAHVSISSLLLHLMHIIDTGCTE